MLLFKRNGYYHVQYFDEIHQRVRRKSLKAKNKNEALKNLTAFKELLKERQRTKVISLSSFRDEYVDYINKSHSKKYLISVKLSFKQLINHLQKDIYLIALSKANAEKFLINVFVKSNYAAYLYLKTLKAAMYKGITWGYIEMNPFKGIMLPKIPKNFPVFISVDELNNLHALTQHQDLKDIFLLAFYTGMRLSELINLQWSAVDFAVNTITVKNSKTFITKNKSDRVIPMHERVSETLNMRKKNSNYVFTKNGCLYKQDYISKKFKEIVRKSELPECVHFHSLRHSFGSNLVQKGVSLYTVKELMGHESITTTQIYSHLKNKNLSDAVKLL